jgi:hypothetical protein
MIGPLRFDGGTAKHANSLESFEPQSVGHFCLSLHCAVRVTVVTFYWSSGRTY